MALPGDRPDVLDPTYAMFREMNEHLRATEQKHLQVSVGFLGVIALALSLLGQQATERPGWVLLHTWPHVIAYYVLFVIGCTAMFAQHIYRGWKKHYVLACKKLAVSWPIDDRVRVSWLKTTVSPYSHPTPRVATLPEPGAPRHLIPGPRIIRISGENGLYYFTFWVTSILLVLFLISASYTIHALWLSTLIIATVSVLYALFFAYIACTGARRKAALETDWDTFVMEELIAQKDRAQQSSVRGKRGISKRTEGSGIMHQGTQLVDLHNHTYCSYDASNRLSDYRRAHAEGRFDVLAITDHNTISGAKKIAECVPEFDVIVGEEIDTKHGEIIGLFLSEGLTPHRSAIDTAKEIRRQDGLVYLQHPYYRWLRKPHRMPPEIIQELIDEDLIDVVEVLNAGPLMWRSNMKAERLAQNHRLVRGAGSDAHHPSDIGRSCMRVPAGPTTPQSLKERLKYGVLVDRHRASVFTLWGRLAYSIEASKLVSGVETKKRAQLLGPHPDATPTKPI